MNVPPSAAVPAASRPTAEDHPIGIIGTGSYTPSRVVTNAELEKRVDTTDDWIVSRTGIRERRVAGEGEHCSDLATEAARRAMAQGQVTADEIDLILVATASPDMLFPATACLVQHKLGARRAAAMDISAACSGFLYCLEIGRQMIASGLYRTVLVVGAEKLTAWVDWTDRNTCVLFGDGAGAVVLRRRPGAGRGLLHTLMGSDGSYANILALPGGGSSCPISPANADQRFNTIKMLGKETFKQAVSSMTSASIEVLDRCGLSPDEIACVIPHQANSRIIAAVAERLKLPIDRFMVNLDRYGNTGAAAVAIALDEAHREGRFHAGDKLLLIVFGAGLTWASVVWEW